jgi:hypothetical protein
MAANSVEKKVVMWVDLMEHSMAGMTAEWLDKKTADL